MTTRNWTPLATEHAFSVPAITIHKHGRKKKGKSKSKPKIEKIRTRNMRPCIRCIRRHTKCNMKPPYSAALCQGCMKGGFTTCPVAEPSIPKPVTPEPMPQDPQPSSIPSASMPMQPEVEWSQVPGRQCDINERTQGSPMTDEEFFLFLHNNINSNFGLIPEVGTLGSSANSPSVQNFQSLYEQQVDSSQIASGSFINDQGFASGSEPELRPNSCPPPASFSFPFWPEHE